MSLDATRWAWQQAIRPSSLKLILLALADRADGSRFECYPSVETVAGDTGLDRKTVIAGIQKLADVGLIEAKRRPNSTTVYRLVGVSDRKDDAAVHYVYRTTDAETGEFYIGVHSSSSGVDRYKGSGRWVTTHPEKSRLTVAVLSQHTSRVAACEAEIEAIKGVIGAHLCRNRRAEAGNLAIAGSTENGTPEVPKTGHQWKYRKRDDGGTENGTAAVPKTGHEPPNNQSGTKNTESALDLSPLPESVSEDLWAAFVKHRRTIKKPLTQVAVNRIGSELHRIEAAGIAPDEALGETLERGWVSVKHHWLENANENRTRTGNGSRPTFDDKIRRLREAADEGEPGMGPAGRDARGPLLARVR